MNAIEEERRKLAHLKELSDVIIDTSAYSVWELKKNIVKLFGAAEAEHAIKVNILSFGYKHGLPQTCDLIFDVRFLDNPYYVAELKNLTGNDEAVRSYVLHSENCPAVFAEAGRFARLFASSLPFGGKRNFRNRNRLHRGESTEASRLQMRLRRLFRRWGIPYLQNTGIF